MPPVTKTSLGYRVDPVQLLTLAEAVSLFHAWGGTAKMETVLVSTRK